MTGDQLRNIYLQGISQAMGHFLIWSTMTADQQNATKAMRDYLTRNDQAISDLLALFNKESET